MAFVAFNYYIRGVNCFFTGKIVSDYFSDDHEGLDKFAKDYLFRNLNVWRKQKSMRPLRRKDVTVGVIGFSACDRSYSSSGKEEARAFDFYVDDSEGYCKNEKVYVNGKLLVDVEDESQSPKSKEKLA